MHDEAWLDDVAAYAVGALPPADAVRMREHLADCAACRDEYAGLAAAAGALAYAYEAEPGEMLKKRIMREVRAGAAQQRRPRAPYAIAAACLAVAAAASFYGWRAGEQNARIRAEVAAITAPGAHAYPVPHGEVVRSGAALYLAMHGLPPPPPGKVYQAWTLPRGAAKMVPSVTFVPRTRSALIRLPVDARRLAAVAVSVEPAGGSLQPTTAPAFVVKFQ